MMQCRQHATPNRTQRDAEHATAPWWVKQAAPPVRRSSCRKILSASTLFGGVLPRPWQVTSAMPAQLPPSICSSVSSGSGVGPRVGAAVGAAVVGSIVGEAVGVVVGAAVGWVVIQMQLCPGEAQSPSEHRWVLAQLHRCPAVLPICSQMPNSVVSQPCEPSEQA